jgi:hypothetical protein
MVIPATGVGHTHSFATTWNKNATNHWNECECGVKNNEAAHTPGNWIIDVHATATTDGSRHKECTVCGYVTETGIILATGGGTTQPPTNTTPPPTNTTPPDTTTTQPPTTTTPPSTTTQPSETTTPPATTTEPPTTSEPQPEYNEGDYISEDYIIDQIESDNPVIDLSETDERTVISAEMLQEIKASGKDVTVILDNGYSFVIKADSITDNAKDFCLNISVEIIDKAQEINGVKFPANSLVITPNFNGAFGFEIVLTVTAEQLAQAGLNGNNVKLFYVDDNNNVTEKGKIKRNADGSVEITLDHASYYVLSDETPIKTGEPTNNGSVDGNPSTGVVIGFTTALVTGAAVIITRKRKRKDIPTDE